MRLAVTPIGFPKTKMQKGQWHHPAIFVSKEIAESFCREWFEEVLEYDLNQYTGLVISKEEIQDQVDDPDDISPIVSLMKSKMTIPFKELWHTDKGYFMVREF